MSTLPSGLHLTDAGRITGRVTPSLAPGSKTLIVSARTPGSKKNPAQTTSALLTLTVN